MTFQTWLGGIATTIGLAWMGWMSLAMIDVKGDIRLIKNRLKLKNGG